MFSAAYYMGPSISSCATTTYGFGDNTAGPIWRHQLPEPQGLLGAPTSQTNYPFGDNLYNPVGYSLVLQTALIKGAQSIAGPVCGYNLINVAGFVISALVMFGFIYALTRKRWIALFTGYAVSYTPYFQMKIGGHPSYGYQALFIAIIWLFYRVVKHRKISDAVALAIAYLASVYFDPYFALFASLILGAIFAGWLMTNRSLFTVASWHKKRGIEYEATIVAKRILLSLAVIVIGLLPLVAIYITKGSQIDSTVAAARGNVVAEAKACSNYPQEYLVPFVLSPVFGHIVGTEKYQKSVTALKDQLSCGIGEDTVGLSLVLMAIVAVGIVIFFWEILNRRRIGIRRLLTFEPKSLIIGIVLIGLAGVLLGLPPTKYQGIIPTPSYELLQITPTWRTLARVYMLVNLSLVIMSAVVLAYFSDHFKQRHKLLLVSFIFITMGTFLEYQAFAPFSGNKLSTFSYANDAPSAYVWLSEQRKLRVIAEYPLEREGGESDAGSYYLTMQAIHKKKLFNSALSNSPQENIKSSIKNLTDPQTIPTLRALGVDAVVAHGISSAEVDRIPGARVVYAADQSAFNLLSHTPTVTHDNIVVINIQTVPAAEYFMELSTGFVRNTTIIKSAADWKYEAVNGSKIRLGEFVDNMLVYGKEKRQVCFSAQTSVPDEATDLIALSDGQQVNLGKITGSLGSYSISASQSVVLNTANAHNIRLTSLGCKTNDS